MVKGQLDFPIISFIIVVIVLMLLAPIVLKIFTSVATPMSAAFGNVSGGQQAQSNFNSVMNTGINFWDKAIAAAFWLALILLIISAFMIDTHPFWVILYVFLCFMTILFTPNILDALNAIYGNDLLGLGSDLNRLSFMTWLLNNFAVFLIGVMALTGIIIYGKIFLFRSGGRQ